MKSSHDMVVRLLEKEKAKISLMWPYNLHCGVLPFLRMHMTWQIQRALHKHRLDEKLANYPLTLQAVLEFSCHLYRLSRIFHRVYRNFFHCLGRSDFLNLLPQYGDAFVAAMLLSMMESIGDLQESKNIPQHLKQRVDFYQAARFKEFHAVLRKYQDRGNQNRTDDQLAAIFDKLLNNSLLVDKYLKFFADIASLPALSQVLQTLSLIATNIGTSKTYEVFLELCKKFAQRNFFVDLVHLSGQFTQCQDPELFQQTFSWVATSALPPEAMSKFLSHGAHLLTSNSEDPKFPISSFHKFTKYVKSKESNLLKMPAEEVEFYLKKAADFFLEDKN